MPCIDMPLMPVLVNPNIALEQTHVDPEFVGAPSYHALVRGLNHEMSAAWILWTMRLRPGRMIPHTARIEDHPVMGFMLNPVTGQMRPHKAAFVTAVVVAVQFEDMCDRPRPRKQLGDACQPSVTRN